MRRACLLAACGWDALQLKSMVAGSTSHQESAGLPHGSCDIQDGVLACSMCGTKVGLWSFAEQLGQILPPTGSPDLKTLHCCCMKLCISHFWGQQQQHVMGVSLSKTLPCHTFDLQPSRDDGVGRCLAKPPSSSFNDVVLRDCQDCRINRPYKDAQNRLLWRDKTCPART